MEMIESAIASYVTVFEAGTLLYQIGIVSIQVAPMIWALWFMLSLLSSTRELLSIFVPLSLAAVNFVQCTLLTGAGLYPLSVFVMLGICALIYKYDQKTEEQHSS